MSIQWQNTDRQLNKKRLPTVLECETREDRRDYRLEIPPDLAWFDGHFPQESILPAVVQLDWAIHFGSELGYKPERFSGFSRLKFKRVIPPTHDLQLALQAADKKLLFSFKSSLGLHSQGTILFGALA